MEEKVKIEFDDMEYENFQIGDKTIKIRPWLSLGEMVYIVETVCTYGKELILNGKSDAIVLVSALVKMEMLITALATNIDMEDVEADKLGEAGIFRFVKEKVLNYDLIKTSIIAGLGMLGDGLIIKQLGNIASLDDLEKAQEKIDGYMKDENNSEKVKSLIEIMLANNPAVAKEINNLVPTGDDGDNGDKE